MKGFLAAAIVVLLVAGGLAVALDMRPVKVTDLPVAELALRPGQTEVTGVSTLFKADNAVPHGLVPAPLTIPRGAATVTGALVGGVRSTIVWDGGRPFVMEPVTVGGLRVEAAAVEVDGGGIRWQLDGTHRFEPGRYRLRTPVAVGASGLARPRDGVEFEADAETGVAFRNGAVTTSPLAELALTGPGVVRIEGRLMARTADDESARPTEAVALQGSYEVTLTPGMDGIRVMGLFQRG
jgi:hypothetical protein